jgi:hypothetical protein
MTGKPQPETAASATPSEISGPAPRIDGPTKRAKRAGTPRNRAARNRIQFPNGEKSIGARSTSPSEKSLDTPTAWPADKIERRPVAVLVPHARDARKHTARQVAERSPHRTMMWSLRQRCKRTGSTRAVCCGVKRPGPADQRQDAQVHSAGDTARYAHPLDTVKAAAAAVAGKVCSK